MALLSPSPHGLCPSLGAFLSLWATPNPTGQKRFPWDWGNIINCFSILGAPGSLSEDVPFRAGFMLQEFSPVPTTQRHLRSDGTVEIYGPQACNRVMQRHIPGDQAFQTCWEPKFQAHFQVPVLCFPGTVPQQPSLTCPGLSCALDTHCGPQTSAPSLLTSLCVVPLSTAQPTSLCSNAPFLQA